MTSPNFQKYVVSEDCEELVNEALIVYPVTKDFLIMLPIYLSLGAESR